MEPVPQMSQRILDSARTSSHRSTYVLMLIEVFSILLAAALLNSFRWNWIDARIRQTRVAIWLIETHPPSPSARTQLVLGNSGPYFRETLCDRGVSEVIEPDRLADLADFLADRRFDNKTLQDYLTSLESIRRDHVLTFPIPLTGLRCDINWLGFIAGLGLAVLLGWLYLSLARERWNLRIAMKHFGPSALYVLSMGAFFDPYAHRFPLSRRRLGLRRLLPTTAATFPIGLLAFIVANDLLTFFRGLRASSGLTWFNTGSELTFLSLCCYFACLIVREYRAIGRLWTRCWARA